MLRPWGRYAPALSHIAAFGRGKAPPRHITAALDKTAFAVTINTHQNRSQRLRTKSKTFQAEALGSRGSPRERRVRVPASLQGFFPVTVPSGHGKTNDAMTLDRIHACDRPTGRRIFDRDIIKSFMFKIGFIIPLPPGG
jgi:hypothetical protein